MQLFQPLVDIFVTLYLGRRLAQGRQKLLRHFRRGSGHNLSFRRSFKLMRSEGGSKSHLFYVYNVGKYACGFNSGKEFSHKKGWNFNTFFVSTVMLDHSFYSNNLIFFHIIFMCMFFSTYSHFLISLYLEINELLSWKRGLLYKNKCIHIYGE